MRFLRFILYLALGAAFQADATTLKGIVLENDTGGPPAADVEVSSPGANITKTYLEGQFRLDFPKLRPGDPVHVSAAKAGYVVVNDFELSPTLPANPDAKLLVIIICLPDSREEMARRFMKIKSLKAIEENYQNSLKAIKISSAEEMTILRAERDQAENAVERIAKELSQVQPSQSSQLNQLAMRFLVEGDTDRALAALNEEELRHNLAVAERKEEEAEKAREQTALDWILRAQLLSSPSDYEFEVALTYFSQVLNRYEAAIAAYEHCLDLARRNGDEVRVSAILNDLARLRHDQKQMEEARKAFEGVLGIFRDLARSNAEIYRSDVVVTLNSMSISQHDRHMQEALRGYHREQTAKEAPETRQDSAVIDDCNLPEVMAIPNDLGNLHSIQKRMDDVRKAYEEALKICRDLAAKKPEAYLPYVAGTLINLGVLYRSQNRMEDSIKAYREVLEIFQGF